MDKNFIMNLFNKKKNKIKKCIENSLSNKKSSSYENKKSYIKDAFKNDDTFIIRDITLENLSKTKVCLCYLNGLVDDDNINLSIVRPLVNSKVYLDNTSDKIVKFLKNNIIFNDNVKVLKKLEECIDSIVNADTVLFVEGSEEFLVFNTTNGNFRSISEPETENVVRGPREGFVENALINITMIRRKLRTNELKFKSMKVGTNIKTNIYICYIDTLVNKEVLKELEKRLKKVKIDGILESNYIEEIVKDNKLSIFNTMGNSERPDRIAADLLEGKVSIVCDGTPIVLTCPYLFIEQFEVNEDYYDNYIYATFNRWLRFLAFFLSISTPAIYIALINYHQEMLPTPLLMSIYAARKGVPLPAILEAFALMIVFEILREAGVRLPNPIGSTISFVGALIIGEASVSAKFISAPIVIVVAIAGISNFLVPKMLTSVIVIKFILLFLASFFGLYGYIVGLLFISLELFSMESFGVEYMAKIGSFKFKDIKDIFIRVPWSFKNKKRTRKNDIVHKRT